MIFATIFFLNVYHISFVHEYNKLRLEMKTLVEMFISTNVD